MSWLPWLIPVIVGMGLIVWGAERFAAHLSRAAARLGVGAFALALLLAGAEPEELATVVVASLRDSPGIAFGDVIGANVAICLVALGLGAVLTPLRFTRRVFVYALAAVPVSALSVAFMWNGQVSRIEGAVLVAMYVVYVAAVWLFERAPPVLGEVEELLEAQEEARPARQARRVGRDMAFVLAGVVAMAAGATMLVESVRQITDVEATQTTLGLTLVGFATAFELVVLVWSAARRGASDIVIAGVVGSFGYNVTMTLGAGALARPLALTDAASLRMPALIMMAAFIAMIALAAPSRSLGRGAGIALLAAYPVFVAAVILL